MTSRCGLCGRRKCMTGMSLSNDDRLRNLSDDRIELLKLLMAESSQAPRPIPCVPRTSVDGCVRFPASVAQQQLWFIDQVGLGSVSYHIPVRIRLSGRLDSQALSHALDELVMRHEALRTTF